MRGWGKRGGGQSLSPLYCDVRRERKRVGVCTVVRPYGGKQGELCTVKYRLSLKRPSINNF